MFRTPLFGGFKTLRSPLQLFIREHRLSFELCDVQTVEADLGAVEQPAFLSDYRTSPALVKELIGYAAVQSDQLGPEREIIIVVVFIQCGVGPDGTQRKNRLFRHISVLVIFGIYL